MSMSPPLMNPLGGATQSAPHQTPEGREGCEMSFVFLLFCPASLVLVKVATMEVLGHADHDYGPSFMITIILIPISLLFVLYRYLNNYL